MLLKLHVLKEDIDKYPFGNCMECPITQAIKRAGYPEWVSCVNVIEKHSDRFQGNWNGVRVFEGHIWTADHPYAIANKRVINMQVHNGLLNPLTPWTEVFPEEPADFDVEFEIPDGILN